MDALDNRVVRLEERQAEDHEQLVKVVTRVENINDVVVLDRSKFVSIEKYERDMANLATWREATNSELAGMKVRQLGLGFLATLLGAGIGAVVSHLFQ